MTLEQSINDLHALGKCDAERLGDQIRDRVIDEVLLRDPNLPSRSFCTWVLVLMGVHHQIVELIHRIIIDRIDRQDVLNELNFFGLLDTEVDDGPLDVEGR
jgi:hypothetical protein